MSFLSNNSYGKSDIRALKVKRGGGKDSVKEIAVTVNLTGDLSASYTSDSNADVVPTDTVRNTVLILARRDPIDSIEDFGRAVARHFIATYSHLATAEVSIVEKVWRRISVRGQAHTHAFVRDGPDLRTAKAFVSSSSESVVGGLKGLVVMKTTQSGFSGFKHDEFTCLPDVHDRVLETSIGAVWRFGGGKVNYDCVAARTRKVLLETFGGDPVEGEFSPSVQRSLYRMGQEVLRRVPELQSITLSMPNIHNIHFDWAKLGLDPTEDLLIPTSEPYGLISGTVTRDRSRL